MNEQLVLTGPSINRGKSNQDYATPDDFMRAVESKFGNVNFDLAASASNSKAPADNFFSKQNDSLSKNWHLLNGLLWLNPPFDNIAPWAKKCWEESLLGANILFLTPASIGSNWFADYVHGRAMVRALNPRLCFDGKNPYPKDCMLSTFSAYGAATGFDVWKWK